MGPDDLWPSVLLGQMEANPASGLPLPHAPPLNGKPGWPPTLVGIQGFSALAPVTGPGLGVR